MEYYFGICQLGTVQTYTVYLYLYVLQLIQREQDRKTHTPSNFFDSNTGSTAVAESAFVAALNSLKNQFCLRKAESLTRSQKFQHHKTMLLPSVPQILIA